jgi:cytoskeletal protein CcmA (bactofilin family)
MPPAGNRSSDMGSESMFNNANRGRSDRPAIPPAPAQGTSRGRGAFSVIGPDMTVTGNLTAAADLHIEGRIEGNVTCGNLVQAADSQIFGNVTADVARIAGQVEGGVRVKQLIVERGARITGDVDYETIAIETGGHVEGRLKHMSEATPAPLRAVPDAGPDEAAA